MGIYSGTVAFQRYRILGGGKKLTLSQLSDLLDSFKAPALKLDQHPKVERMGWVRPLTPQDPDVIGEDAHWDASDCQVSGGFMLRMRYERRKVPMSLLQMLYKQKVAEHAKETGKPLPRAERQKLKEDLANDLLKRTLPQIQFTDVLWRDQDQELYIFSGSKAICERVLQLFGETFAQELDLNVIKLSATTAWIEADDVDLRIERITKVEPSVFARQLS